MKSGEKWMVLFVMAGILLPLSASAGSLTLYAAGSLKTALGEVAAAYEKVYGTEVKTKFAPSGLLRKTIEGGERPDVFASANMAHPETLAKNGWAARFLCLRGISFVRLPSPGSMFQQTLCLRRCWMKKFV